VKTYGEGKLDLGLLVSEYPCTTAATYTKNVLHSASVDINRAKLAAGPARGVVVNSGVANSSTGDRGIADGNQLTAWAATKAGLDTADILICSTGVIAITSRWKAGCRREGHRTGCRRRPVARAIMTTDTRPKSASVRVGRYTLGGC
jgi:glutamate N-acetyltransferase/amino-acid N-acetyltransferase